MLSIERKTVYRAAACLTIIACLLVGATVWAQWDGPSVVDADSGDVIRVAVGEAFVVTLESNPSTGFRWEPRDLDETQLILQDTVYQSGGSNLPGAAGSETLTFKTRRAGESTLTLIYHRPWEDAEPLNTVAYRVIAE